MTRAGVRVSDIGAGLAPRTRTRSGRRPQGMPGRWAPPGNPLPLVETHHGWILPEIAATIHSFLTRPLDRSSYGAAGHWIAPLPRPEVGSQPGTAIIVRRRAKRQGSAHVSRGGGRFGQRRLSQVTHRPEREEGRANRPALLPSGAFLWRSEQGVTSGELVESGDLKTAAELHSLAGLGRPRSGDGGAGAKHRAQLLLLGVAERGLDDVAAVRLH